MRMKLYTKKVLAVMLALALLLGMIPLYTVPVNALTPTYSVSSAYKASSYYTSLCAVTLTGNQRDDIINVALSQVGYCEGNSSGDYGGENDGYYNNYTEFNYWYNNYENSGMPVGGSYAPWCATFVSWCAEQAQIPDSILQRSTAAGHSSWYFNVNFYAGGSTLNADRDNTDKFMGYNYTPKKGDLFFTRTWSHVGLVVGVSGDYVMTVEGNTNSGGSAEGEGVYRRYRYITDLYFGVPEYVEDYTSSCTYYPSHCQFKVNTSTPINSQPCSVSTANNSVSLGTATAGQTYTATGLYLNGYGNYWYRVQTGSGKTGYVYAGDTTYVKQLISDITLADAEAPSAHISGSTFTVNGTAKSQYNRLDQVSCYIYSGFGSNGSAVTGYADSVGSTQYALDGSDVDYNTSFGSLTRGNYTYEIAATYTNYYATGATSKSSNTGTVKLMTEYFVVIPSSVSQSGCSHSYTTTMVGAATCLEGGTQVKACATCGLVTKTEIASGSHSFGGWTTVSNATCTADGTKTRTCSVCNYVDTQTLVAYGHDYSTRIQPATCTQYATYEFTCGICGNYYKRTEAELASGWIDFLPEGMDAGLFRTQTQYRYSDYETKTSTSASLAGYTQTGSSWVQSGTGSIQYVPTWPSGFSTGSSLYTKYNNAGAKKTPSETASAKTEIHSDEQAGYLYYHWCYTDSYYSVASQSGSYTTFHAYFDTTDPSTYTCDTSDMSYKTSHSTCSNTNWWFVTDVYQQDYTTYQKQYTYERWTDFSDWSATAVTAGSTRKVETRTVYQLKNAPSLAGHSYVSGTCTVCGASNSGSTPASTDYYLFGYINGANYACEEDYANLGIYKFNGGKLTVTFDSDSYVAVKDGDNLNWYMTSGWLGTETTSATLYKTGTLSNADKLFVPGGKEVTFTLNVNADDTLTLSYTIASGPVATPTLTPKYPSLSFEDEVFINVYFSATNLGSVTTADMGLLTWTTARTDGTVNNANANIPGATAVDGLYCVRTKGIPAKCLGDTVYFKVYMKLSDGSYVYSDLLSYSPKSYATSILSSASSSAKQKALCVAMLNYGAAAQSFFSYKAYSLANNSLTAAQKALVSGYNASMVAAVGSVNSNKVGIFTNSGGFTQRYPTVSFESAFCINYYFVPANTPSGSVRMYYWNAADYNAASTLTPANATGCITMTATNGVYEATVDGIAAKDLDGTIYVAAGYMSGGTSYCTGVLAYSIGTYCKTVASGTSSQTDLAKATAVYGYYAKQLFS